MTQPVPPRYSPRGGKKYIRPRFVTHGQIPSRGKLSRPFVAKPKSLTELRIIFPPEGGVRMPRYREREGNPTQLEHALYVHLPNPYAAIRYSAHQRESISQEARAVDTVIRQVGGVHFSIEKELKTFNNAQKKSVCGFLSGLAGALGNPNALESHYKKHAQERLQNAAESLARNNSGAALLRLSGASNDLVARKNQLTRQREFIQRRAGELIERTTIERARLEKYAGDMLRRMDTLRLPTLSHREIEGLLQGMRMEYRSLLQKREPELKEAATILAQAGNAVKSGEYARAHARLRDVNRLVIRALSRQYLLNETLLGIVEKSAYPEHRRAVFTQQLFTLADNAGFWFQRAKDKESMAKHLIAFARAAKKEIPPQAIHDITHAAFAIRKGDATLVEEKLLHAYEVATQK